MTRTEPAGNYLELNTLAGLHFIHLTLSEMDTSKNGFFGPV